MNSLTRKSDVLVIGGGIAGLFSAITAAQNGCSVVLVEKNFAGKSGASIMGSGQLNVFKADWGMDFDNTVEKNVRIGEYINNREWLKTMMRESWGIYENLRDWGVEFPSSEEDFRRYMNSVHDWQQLTDDNNLSKADIPAWGMVPLKHREVPPKLRRKALAEGVTIVDHVTVTELLKSEDRVCGAVGFSTETGDAMVFYAKAVVMAAGKNCFRSPGMNIAELTGDADAMAYRAGATISGKEFPDLHMGLVRDPVWKGTGEIYPAYWNFVDCNGEPIPMHGFDLSMVSVIHAGKGPVMWDFEHMTEDDRTKIENYIKKRNMPHECERIRLGFFDKTNEQITGGSAGGGPAEQSAGIMPVGLNCASTVEGLYAAGDCCCTMAWGAINEGAPPGLLPASVTGKHAGAGAAEFAKSVTGSEPDAEAAVAAIYAPLERKGGYDPRWVCQLLQNTMLPYYVIHIKSGDRLQAALTNVAFYRDHMVPMLKANNYHELRLCHETKNMILNAEMILRASLAREESRGWHYREDFPEHDDDNWLAWVTMQQSETGMKTAKYPLPEEWLADDPKEDRYTAKWLAFLQ